MTTAQNRFDAAFGSILGACVGDAAGATLEFQDHVSAAAVERAMQMVGGGVWGTAPGQITDDSELALCLAHGLAGSANFDLEAIARQYIRWLESPPFDIGNTTRTGLGAYRRPDCDQAHVAGCMQTAAQQHNMGSKANGSLMRATPLAVWGADLPTATLADYAQQDSSLTHPHPSCWQAVACYVIAIAHLINHHGDRHGAFGRAREWADAYANDEIREWLVLAENNVDLPYTPLIGFVKIGFVHAFRHLLLGTEYATAVAETLAGGGDTDTNACIVGGLVGAAVGAAGIPERMRVAVLECETRDGRPRPDFLHTTQLPKLTRRLLEK